MITFQVHIRDQPRPAWIESWKKQKKELIKSIRKFIPMNPTIWCILYVKLYFVMITFQVHIRDQPRPAWIESWKNKKKNLSSQFENSSLWILPFDVFCMSNCILKWLHFRCIFGINPDQRGSKVEKNKKKELIKSIRKFIPMKSYHLMYFVCEIVFWNDYISGAYSGSTQTSVDRKLKKTKKRTYQVNSKIHPDESYHLMYFVCQIVFWNDYISGAYSGSTQTSVDRKLKKTRKRTYQVNSKIHPYESYYLMYFVCQIVFWKDHISGAYSGSTLTSVDRKLTKQKKELIKSIRKFIPMNPTIWCILYVKLYFVMITFQVHIRDQPRPAWIESWKKQKKELIKSIQKFIPMNPTIWCILYVKLYFGNDYISGAYSGSTQTSVDRKLKKTRKRTYQDNSKIHPYESYHLMYFVCQIVFWNDHISGAYSGSTQTSVDRKLKKTKKRTYQVNSKIHPYESYHFDVFCMSNCILKWLHFRCIFGINPDQRGSKVEKNKKKNLSSQFENSPYESHHLMYFVCQICNLKWLHFSCIFGINPDQRGSKVEKTKKRTYQVNSKIHPYEFYHLMHFVCQIVFCNDYISGAFSGSTQTSVDRKLKKTKKRTYQVNSKIHPYEFYHLMYFVCQIVFWNDYISGAYSGSTQTSVVRKLTKQKKEPIKSIRKFIPMNPTIWCILYVTL